MNTQQHTTRTSTRTRIVRVAFAAAATAATIGFATTTPADAVKHQSGPRPSTTESTTVRTPCFDVPTADRWAADVGAVPQCDHAYGNASAYARIPAFEGVAAQRFADPPAAAEQQIIDAYRRAEVAEQINFVPGPTATDSPCFMNPMRWDVGVDGGVPVCIVR